MAEIIHVPAGEQPKLDPPCCVYEWIPDGKYRVEQMPSIGSWYHVPADMWDTMIASAAQTADHLGHARVYILERPA